LKTTCLKKTRVRAVAIAWLLCSFAMNCRAQKWERIGPEGGDAISLSAAGKGEIFLGTADGHIFGSQDSGEHWELRGRAGKRLDGVVQKIVVDIRENTRLYAAVWTQDPAAGGGVYRSENGGKTWEGAGLQGEAVRALAQSASNPEIFVAGTKTGVFLSSDAGTSWMRISPIGDEELKNLDSIAIDPRDANVIYAGTYHLPWKTMDGGKNWKAIAAGMIDDSDVMSVVVDRSQPERIFASACSGIYRSENGGAQWTKLQGIPYVSRRTQEIAQDPANAAVWYAGTTEGLWRSDDAGESWARVTGRDIVVNAIAFSGKEQQLLLGTEDGVLMSSDGGKSFAARNTGFTHQVVRTFAVSDTNVQRLLAAIEGGNKELLESADEGKSWRAFGAPAAGVMALFSFGDDWFAALRGGGASQFDAKTGQWKELRFVIKETIRMRGQKGATLAKRMRERVVRPEVSVIRATGGKIFIATNEGLWTGGAHGGVMQRIAEKEFSEKIADLATNHVDGELFVVTQNRLARSTNAGKTWELISTPQNAGELLWARVENHESNALIMGARNGVFEYEFGAGGKEWKLLQSGLPAAASWPVAMSDQFWMIAMRTGGVYQSRDDGRSWEWLEAERAGLVLDVVSIGNSRVWIRAQTDGLFLMKTGSQAAN
jgi:photosystem II stability/assembly factor-like uncharacterized protein